MMKTRADRARDLFLLVFTFLFLYSIVAGLNYDINYWESRCLSSSKVEEITKVRYRSVWFTLEDGTEVEGGQPKTAVVPGAEYCTSWTRERNDEPLSWWMMPVKVFE